MTFTVRSISVTLALVLLLGLAIWQFQPELQKTIPVQLAEEPWNLHKLPTLDLKKAINYLTTTTMWGNVEIKKIDEIPVEEPKWRFLGVMANGSEKYVLIDIEKQPSRQLKVGDMLPGEVPILEIGPDYICVTVNGKKRSLPIYPQGKQNL